MPVRLSTSDCEAGVGVIVGSGVTVGSATVPGITSTWPMLSTLSTEMLFARARSSVLTPKRMAMRPSRSPSWTMYSTGAPDGVAAGADAGAAPAADASPSADGDNGITSCWPMDRMSSTPMLFAWAMSS